MKWTEPINVMNHRSVVPFPGDTEFPVWHGTRAECKRYAQEHAKAAVVAYAMKVLSDEPEILDELEEMLEPDQDLVNEYLSKIDPEEPVPVYLIVMTLSASWSRRLLLAFGRKGILV